MYVTCRNEECSCEIYVEYICNDYEEISKDVSDKTKWKITLKNYLKLKAKFFSLILSFYF